MKSHNKMGIKPVIKKVLQPFLGLFTRFKKAFSVEPTWTERDELDHGFGGKWYSKRIVFDLNQFFYSEKVPPCYMNTSYDQYNFFGGIADTLVIIGILSIACFPKLAESYALKCKALEKAQQEIEQINQNAKIRESLDNMNNQLIDSFQTVAKHQSNKASAAEERAVKAEEKQRVAERKAEEDRIKYEQRIAELENMLSETNKLESKTKEF